MPPFRAPNGTRHTWCEPQAHTTYGSTLLDRWAGPRAGATGSNGGRGLAGRRRPAQIPEGVTHAARVGLRLVVRAAEWPAGREGPGVGHPAILRYHAVRGQACSQ